MKDKREIRLTLWGLLLLFIALTSLPFLVPGLGFLALVIAGYMLLTTSIKKAYIRHYGSLL